MLFGENNGNNSVSTISEGVKIEGKIHFPGSAKVDGIVVGDIISENILTIGREGNDLTPIFSPVFKLVSKSFEGSLKIIPNMIICNN